MAKTMVKKIMDAAEGRWLSNKSWIGIIIFIVVTTVGLLGYIKDSEKEYAANKTEINSLTSEIKDLREEMKSMRNCFLRLEAFIMQEYGHKYHPDYQIYIKKVEY